MDDGVILIVGIVLGISAIVAVAARFYARYSTNAGFRWDDWLILVAITTMIIIDALAVYGSSSGLQPQRRTVDELISFTASSSNPTGPEAATVATETQEFSEADQQYNRLVWSLTVVYFFTTSSTKLSILLMYYRLFSINRALKIQIMFLSIVVGCWFVGCTIADLTNCIPLEYSWINSLTDPRYCFNYNHYWFAAGLLESLVDILIILLPINVILALQLPRRQKLAVGFVFLLGALVIISGLLKTGFGYIPNSRNPSFSNTQIWATVHMCTGIICACLPICWPLMKRLGRIQLHTGPGASWIKKHWYSISGGTSTNSQEATVRERRENFEQVENNLTSRVSDITFNRLENPSYEDEYTLRNFDSRPTPSMV